MIADLEAWIELNQAGRLLDRRALEALPEPGDTPWNMSDRLRDALTAAVPIRSARPDRRSSPPSRENESFGELLDVVLEEVCGLKEGWRKGPLVGAAESETLLDGTPLKPHRVLALSGQTVLAVFVTSADRVGIHKGRRAFAHVVEYLRRRRVALGVLTNGREWRLVFADADNLAWVEWAADRWLESNSLTHGLGLLRRVLSPASLAPIVGSEDESGTSKLLTAIRQTRRGQARLSKELGERVRACVELLLRARRPALESSWIEAESKSVYDAACHFVMRLVVVLFAEARELLPVDSPIYHHAYGLRGLLEALGRTDSERRRSHTSAWPRLLALFRLLHQGSLHPQLVVTSYGGDLFKAGDATADATQRALALLETTTEPPEDETVYRMLVLLTRTTERVREGNVMRIVAAPVDFTELTSEYIGILYEGLLDYELHRVGNQPIVFLALGDQPALPLDRLEAMPDKQLAALVEKAKVKRESASDEEEVDGENDDAEGDEPTDHDIEVDDLDADRDAMPPLDEIATDDVSAEAMKRALAWAERAAIAGKLVRAPRGRKGTTDTAWRAELTRAAQAMIARAEVEPGKWSLMVKLPGEFYLVRWGGTRKGAGTFYTRPQLALPTVRRTLEPLLMRPGGRLRSPEELLALKVCDPAMGSGSFLVAALRVLTEVVVRSLHEHGRVVRRADAGTSELISIECELLPEADRDQPYERVEAIVRRAVVEHCLYGVDLDPLAVELARVSLWVETLDRRLPFTFLDHKLRCGDALVGTWLDRFRDYPLLAWWRQSPDEKWRGVTHEGDTWAKQLKELRASIVDEQRRVLAGELRLPFVGTTDDELKVAIERVRELYRRLRKVPASQPDRRAEIWRTQVAVDPALERVREAFDTWCALWFWPLERLGEAPRPLDLLAPSEGAREIIRDLRAAKRFFHWELEFPDVFTEKGSGFDAIVANPPWETLQAQSKEFFTDVDPLYRSYGKQHALSRQRELFAEEPAIERRWLEELAIVRNMVNFTRHVAEPFGGVPDSDGRIPVALVPRKSQDSRRLHQRWSAERARRTGLSDPNHAFQVQGDGKPYSYKLFVEQAHVLLKASGQLGLITPSGLYADKGTAELRELLLERCSWRWLYGFENRDQVFDIHASFKFAVSIAEKGGTTRELKVAFMRRELEDWSDARGTLVLPATAIRQFSPKSLSILEICFEKDIAVLESIYKNSLLLGEPMPNGWGAAFGREFNITDDSKLFSRVEDWEAKGFRSSGYGRWTHGDEIAVPVYQGALVHQFDFAFARFAGGSGHGINWEPLPWHDKRMAPQNLMSMRDVAVATTGLRLLFRKIGNPTNVRTMLAALAPSFPAVDTIVIVKERKASRDEALCAFLNSFVFDWLLRLRFGGSGGVGALDHAKMHEAAAPLPGGSEDILVSLVYQLNLANELFAPSWHERARTGVPVRAWKRLWAIALHERRRVRAILDAVVAALYGVSRSELAWILRDCDHPKERLADKVFCRTLNPKGFWRVDKSEDPELRHPVLTLVAFDALNTHIAAHGGDRDAGVAAFAALNDGEGWMLPEMLRLADHGLGHDDRARAPQAVASRLGPRFLDWQLGQVPGESWAECERHARAILGEEAFKPSSDANAQGVHTSPLSEKIQAPSGAKVVGEQQKLFE